MSWTNTARTASSMTNTARTEARTSSENEEVYVSQYGDYYYGGRCGDITVYSDVWSRTART